jgi:ATP10 protein
VSPRALAAQARRDTSLATSLARGDALRPGDLFPQLVGEALSGESIVVPDTTSGRFTVVALTFSRSAGDDAQRWRERLASDPAMHDLVRVLTVAELEGAPRLMRGLITRAIRRGTTPSLRAQTMVLDRDEGLWKRRLAVSETSRAYVVLIAPNGRIRWVSDGPYDGARFAALRSQLP